MPECRGFTVHVTDVHGQSLPEWGVQHINLQQQSRRVSAHIQSTTDAIFQVSLQPRIPWCDNDHPYSDDPDDWLDAGGRERNIANYRAKYLGVPPYTFVAALYLDGRERPERRVIIYTDPNDPNYDRPDGKVFLKHRMVQHKDGRIIEHGWVFKEKAIDLVFDKLNLKAHQDNDDEAALVDALQSQLTAVDKDQGRNRVGEIRIDISRVTVGPSYIDPNYKARFKEGQDDDVDANKPQGDINHRAGFVRKGMVPRREVKNPLVVEYRPWKSGEGVYASFYFFYRSREQLAKFGFPGFPPLPNGARKDRRFLDNTLSNLTPLSISEQAKSSSKRAKSDVESFEDKVKKRQSSRISADAQMPAQSDKILPSQLRDFSDPVKASKSIATPEAFHTKAASKTTIPPPLPPSSQTLSKSQLEKLASQTSKPITDDEAETEISEPGTESDLESLPRDDKVPTDTNSEEEDPTHKNLREQLRGITIRKRRNDALNQEFDSRSTLAQLKSSKDGSTRDLNLIVKAPTPIHRMKLVQKEDDDEGTRSKRIKSE